MAPPPSPTPPLPRLQSLLATTTRGKDDPEFLQTLNSWEPSKFQPKDTGWKNTEEGILAALPPAIANTLRKHLGSRNLSFLGSGSSRAAFDVGGGAVLKIALNAAGQNQNKVESKLGRNPGTANLIPRTLRWDDRGKWLVVEKADQVSPEEFQDLLVVKTTTRDGTVVSGPSLGALLADEPPRFVREDYWDSMTPLQREVADLVWRHKILPGDLDRHVNWGKTKDGRLVIIDPGLDEDTWKVNYA